MLDRIEQATRLMAALEHEIQVLRQRAEHCDVSAIHLGLRQITEALLRHAAREESVSVQAGADGTLNRLKNGLTPSLRGKVGGEFWAHVDVLQRYVNHNAHHQHDDVYHAAGLQSKSDPWDQVRPAMIALACIAEEFSSHWPGPARVTPESVAEAETHNHDEAQPAQPDGTKVHVREGGIDLFNLSVAQVRDDEAIKARLAKLSGLHPRGVSRRLNGAHGRTKVRNLFPNAFEEVFGSVPDQDEDLALDYESIGNLTIKEARELEVAPDIAILTGLTVRTVSGRLGKLHGGGIVRRQFPWYDPDVVGDFTAHTARTYRLGQILALTLGQSREWVQTKLSEVPGQTKLKTVFPELDW